MVTKNKTYTPYVGIANQSLSGENPSPYGNLTAFQQGDLESKRANLLSFDSTPVAPTVSPTVATTTPVESAAKPTGFDSSSLTPIGTAIGGIGSIINAITTWYYTDKQIEENKKIQQQQIDFTNRQLATEEQHYQTTLALTKDEIKYQRAQDAWKKKYQTNVDKINYAGNVMGGISRLINSKPEMLQSIIQRWQAV